MRKSLKEKAVKIQGKNYVLVSDRILAFNEEYPEGSITTELITPWESEQIIVKARVSPNDKQIFTAYSQAVKGVGMVNKTSALENAETSAVGRALAFMGIGVLDSVASVDEMAKAGAYQTPRQTSYTPRHATETPTEGTTTKTVVADYISVSNKIKEINDLDELERLDAGVYKSKKLTNEEKNKLHAEIMAKTEPVINQLIP